ncbi:MAG: hypothetical protein ABSE81_04965 [Candidatus Omnitrophota bacterium]|jgi:MoaA/NifB/PqqE/SkfB family radical SAM enzyme
MKDKFISKIPLLEFNLWNKFKSGERKLVSFDLELTGRCNNNCRHCYINLPVNDSQAVHKELTKLLELKVIKSVGEGRALHYILV